MTTSDSLTASTVRIFGVLPAMSMPVFRHGVDGDGVDLVLRLGAGRADLDAAGAELAEVPGGHLGAAGVVDADEEDGRLLGGHVRNHR